MKEIKVVQYQADDGKVFNTKVVKDNHKDRRNKERAKSLGYNEQPISLLDKSINLLYNINSKGDEFK